MPKGPEERDNTGAKGYVSSHDDALNNEDLVWWDDDDDDDDKTQIVERPTLAGPASISARAASVPGGPFAMPPRAASRKADPEDAIPQGSEDGDTPLIPGHLEAVFEPNPSNPWRPLKGPPQVFDERSSPSSDAPTNPFLSSPEAPTPQESLQKSLPGQRWSLNPRLVIFVLAIVGAVGALATRLSTKSSPSDPCVALSNTYKNISDGLDSAIANCASSGSTQNQQGRCEKTAQEAADGKAYQRTASLSNKPLQTLTELKAALEECKSSGRLQVPSQTEPQ